jgi:hypothetical protein
MSSSTSIGRGPAHGSNESHDGDPSHKTLGETTSQDEPPMGNDLDEEPVPQVDAAREKLPGDKGNPSRR